MYWDLYILLREIMDIAFSKNTNRNICEFLSINVQEHNELYMKLSNSHLKPKFNFLTHYPFVMQKVGPLSALSS